MKKFIASLIGLSLIAAPVIADARPRGRGADIIAPLIIGGIIGGAIVESTRPPVTYVPAPSYTPYTTVIVSRYYDRFHGTCEVSDTRDYYGNFITRQTVCYGD